MKTFFLFLLWPLLLCGQGQIIAYIASSGDSSPTLTPPSFGPIQVSVAYHSKGYTAAFTENSDDSSPAYELYLCRNNLGGTANFGVNTAYGQDVYKFGRADVGVYTHVLSYTTDVSNVTTLRGGAPPTTGGYAVGDTSYRASMVPLVLDMRNTLWESRGKREYSYGPGITAAQWSSRASTISFAEYCVQKDGADPNYNFIAGTNAQGYAQLDTIVPQIISAHGWYTNFMHSQWYNTNYPRDYFAGINSRIGSADVCRCTQKEIVEYYWLRESVTSVSVVDNTVTVNYAELYSTSPYANITTSLWLKIDVSGSSLSGKDITTSHGGKIRSMGGDIFYVSVPLNYSNSSVSFDISETTSPNYINLNVPNVTVIGNTITSDQPIKFKLFKKTKAQTDVDCTVVESGTTLSTNQYIFGLLDKVTYDYYLGFINAEGISGLLEPASFQIPGGHTSDIASTIATAGASLVYDFDYRYNVSTGGGYVYSWVDQSANSFELKPTSTTLRFFAMSDGFGDNSSTNTISMQAAFQSPLKTTHDGSPFIQIAIFKKNSTASVNFHVGSTNQSSNPGALLQVLCSTGNLSFQAQNNAGTSLGGNNTAASTVATGRFVFTARKYYGSGTGSNNAKMYTEATATNFSYNPTFGTGNSTRLYTGKTAGTAIDFRIKRMILIKCTGLTSGQIDTLFGNIITQIKTDPEYSSLTTP